MLFRSAVEVPAGSVANLVVDSIALTGSAAVLSGLAITGSGKVVVSALQATPGADLSRIETATVEASLDLGSAVISVKGESADTPRTIDLANVAYIAGGDYELEIGEDNFSLPEEFQYSSLFAIVAALAIEINNKTPGSATVDGTKITVSGAGLKDIDFELEVKVTGHLGKSVVSISGMGEVNIDVGANLGAASFIVAKGTELEGSWVQLNGKTVNGDGNLAVLFGHFHYDAMLNSTNFAASLRVTAEIEGYVNLTGQTLSNFDGFEIHSGRLIITAEQASGRYLWKDSEGDSYGGSVTIIGSDGDQTIDVSNIDGYQTFNVIAGGEGADKIKLGAGSNMLVYSSSDTLTAVDTADALFGNMDLITGWAAGFANQIGLVTVGAHTFVAQEVTQLFVEDLLVGNADLLQVFTAVDYFLSAGEVTSFQFGGNTYVFANLDNNSSAQLGSGDLAIELIGLHSLNDQHFMLGTNTA